MKYGGLAMLSLVLLIVLYSIGIYYFVNLDDDGFSHNVFAQILTLFVGITLPYGIIWIVLFAAGILYQPNLDTGIYHYAWAVCLPFWGGSVYWWVYGNYPYWCRFYENVSDWFFYKKWRR